MMGFYPVNISQSPDHMFEAEATINDLHGLASNYQYVRLVTQPAHVAQINGFSRWSKISVKLSPYDFKNTELWTLGSK